MDYWEKWESGMHVECFESCSACLDICYFVYIPPFSLFFFQSILEDCFRYVYYTTDLISHSANILIYVFQCEFKFCYYILA